MHEQSRFFSAPALSVAALILAGSAFAAELVVRTDLDDGIVRAISSDDQVEIESIVETDIAEDFQEDLVAIVQDTSLSPLTSDVLRSTLFFRSAPQTERSKYQAFVGKMLAKRKRHEEALAILTALSPEQRIEHGASFSYAQSYRGAGNIDAAINAYALHIAANPNHNPGYVNYGILLAETDRHEEAIRVFERSVDITSSSRKGKSLSLLGQSQVALGLYTEAIDAFDLSIQYRPDNGPTWRRFATTKARSGDYPSEEIEADYQRALALAPDDAETMKEWAEFNFSFGRFETALPLFRTASTEAANDFDILFSRAVNLMASERPRAARQVIRKMANVEMSTEQNLLLLGLQEASGVIRPPTQETLDQVCAAREAKERVSYSCLLLQLEMQDMDAALNTFSELPLTSIYTQPAEFALARYEYRQGAAASASERLEDLLAKNPQSPLFWLYTARNLSALETAAKAAEIDSAVEVEIQDEAVTAQVAFQKALELNPESRKITLEFSDHLVQSELYAQAETLLTGFLVVKPNDATVLMALAGVYAEAGNPERAEETLLQLMEMSDEEDTETIQNLVAVQVSLEKYEDALGNADNLLDQDPANVPVRRLRVEALAQLGRDDEAAEEAERIQRLMPASDAEPSSAAEIVPGSAAP